MTTFEKRLPEAMREAVAGFEPPPDLVAAGLARGRRMRRTRRLRVTGALTSAAVVAVGGVVAGGHLVAGSGEPARVAAGLRSPDAPAAEPISGRELIETLRDLLPGGGSMKSTRATGTEHPGRPGSSTVSVTFDDGRGASAVQLRLLRLPHGDDRSAEVTCPPVQVRPHDVCTASTRPDGSALVVNKSHTWPHQPAREKFWYAVLTRKDGAQVRVEQYNSAQEKSDAGPTRTDPVLTPEQMTAVVTSARWNKALASLPVPVPAPVTAAPTTYPDPPGEKVLATLKSLLPSGVRVTRPTSQDGHASVVFTDDRGSSTIEVNVQPGMSHVRGISCRSRRASNPPPRSCEKTTRADGTVTYVEEGPAEVTSSGVVVRIADVVYPDDLRVVVTIANGTSSKSGPRTRPAPALSSAQLLRLAASPAWRDALLPVTGAASPRP